MIVRQTGAHTERALTDLFEKNNNIVWTRSGQSFKISRYTQITTGYICIRLIKIVPGISFREHILQSRASHSAAPRARGSAAHPLSERFHARRRASVHLPPTNVQLETCIKCSSERRQKESTGGGHEVPNRKHR